MTEWKRGDDVPATGAQVDVGPHVPVNLIRQGGMICARCKAVWPCVPSMDRWLRRFNSQHTP
jgi:hypothetical protein